MKRISRIIILCLPFLLTANSVFASGFGLYEFSARGNAMGGAVLAGEAEPASLALNPALITQLPGKQVQVGATLVTASATTQYGEHTQSSNREWWPLPTFYYTQQLSDRWWAGIGAFARFGLSNTFSDKSWLLPTTGINASLYHVAVESYSIQPTVAFQATDRLSVSAGVEIQYLKFIEGIRFGNQSTTYADLDLDGDSLTASGILAFFYEANEKVNFGGSFRFRNDHHVRGPVDYNNTTPSPYSFVKSGDFWGDITFPAQLALGASWKPTEKWLFEFNWTNVFWSCFRSVNIYFDNRPIFGGEGLMGSQDGNMKEYQDSYRIGLGAEYTLTDRTKLRGSFIYDKSPLNNRFLDVMLPVDDRFLLGTGVGFDLGKGVILDLGYTFLFASHLNGVAADGTTHVYYAPARSHLMSASVRYKF